jgi:membrane protein implicated in regulation of membrane protease activity
MYVFSLGVAAILAALVIAFAIFREWKIAGLIGVFLALLVAEIFEHWRKTARRQRREVIES